MRATQMFAMMSDSLFQFTFQILAFIIIIIVIIPEMSPIIIVGLVVFHHSVLAIDRTNRMAKRHTMLSLSPIMTTVAETVNARALIHVMRFEDFFLARQMRNVDTWNRLVR